MHQNSLFAYHTTVKPNTGKRNDEIIGAIETLGKATRQDIADHLGLGVNCVTRGVLDMLESGTIRVCGVDRSTGRKRDLVEVAR